MDRATRSRALKRPRPGEASNPRSEAAGAPPPGIGAVDSPVPAKRGRVNDTQTRATRRRKSIVEPLPRHFGLPLWGAASAGQHSSYFDTKLATLVDSTLGRQSLADTQDLSPWLMSGSAPNFDRQQRAVLQEQLRKRLQEDATIASALSPPSVSKQPSGKRSRPTHNREGQPGTSLSSDSSSSSSSSSAAARADSQEQTETQRFGKRSRHTGTFGGGSAASSGAGVGAGVGAGEVSAESLLRALDAEKEASIAFQGQLRESVQPTKAGSGGDAGFGGGQPGKEMGGETSGERGGEDEEGGAGASASAAMVRRGKQVRRRASSAAKTKASGSDTAAGAGAGGRRVQPRRQSKRLRAGKPSQSEQADMEEG